MFGKIANFALLVLIGIVFAALGTVAHQSVARLGVVLPWGLAVSLIAAGCLLVGLRLVNESRTAPIAAAIGLVGAISILSLRSYGGSVLIPNNLLGTIWVIAPVVIALVVIAWPRLGKAEPRKLEVASE